MLTRRAAPRLTRDRARWDTGSSTRSRHDYGASSNPARRRGPRAGVRQLIAHRWLSTALAVAALAAAPAGAERDRGARSLAPAATPALAPVAESHALVIGMANYRRPPGKAGWSSLAGVAADVKEVSSTLQTLGFQVESHQDLTGQQLAATLRAFVDAHGLAIDNRLLIYFAGHGESLTNTYGATMGYLVPVDAPAPAADRDGFLRVALSMNEVESLSRRIQSRHALFVFDACFAGTIFSVMRGNSTAAIDYLSSAPVRQFITAGDEHQQVPDASVFRRQFVAGLTAPHGLNADLNHDGYVTGTELGEFLFENVKRYRKQAQTPRYGKLGDPVLNRGDFLFRLAAPDPAAAAAAAGPGKVAGFNLIASSDGKPLAAGDPVELGSRVTVRVRATGRTPAQPGFVWLLGSDEGGVRALSPQVKVAAPLPAPSSEIALPDWVVAGQVGPIQLVALGTTREVAAARIEHELLASLLGGGPERVAAEFVVSPSLRLQRVRPAVPIAQAPPLRLEIRSKAGGAVVAEGGTLVAGGKFEVVVRYQPEPGGPTGSRHLYVFGLDQGWTLTLLSSEAPPRLPVNPAVPSELSMGSFVVGQVEGNDVFFLLATEQRLPELDFWSPPEKRGPATRELVDFLAGLVGGSVDSATVQRRIAAIADEPLHRALQGCSLQRVRTSSTGGQ